MSNGPRKAEPLKPITVAALREQLREQAAIVASNADEQLAWCKSGSVWVPVDEIVQSYEDMVFVWFARLKYEGLDEDPEAARLLHELSRQFQSMWDANRHALWQDEGLSEPEWEQARAIAKDLLRALDATA